MILLVLPDIPAEDRLLERARQGDRDAVGEIYDQYFEAIFQFIRLRVEDPALAEDLASEVFMKLVTSLNGRNAPRKTLRGWLFRVARNLLHDHYSGSQYLNETVLDEWLPAPDHEQPESTVFAVLDARRVRRALRMLADDQQEVLLLRFGQALSLQETADIMGKRVGAVKSLQFRATNRLRDLLEGMAG
ncbi:MAG: sigma-70 family RNA polymerase sigma factor [Anaerolineae bacterium]|nr:sigma-70 family RNA polymerase sigma factor [Anaerolineae bacterium]